MAFTLVTLTDTWTNGDGTPATGKFTFRLSEPMSNSGSVRTTSEFVATLDNTGTLSVQVAANDDTATLPIGTFYSVTEEIDGAPPRDYEISVTAASAPSVSLSSLIALNPAGDATGATTRFATFIDLDEAKEWLRYDPSGPVVGNFDANLQRIIDMACTHIQTHIGRPAAPQTFVERHDGWSGEYIMLKHAPVQSMVYCHEWQSSGGLIVLPESTPANPVDGVQVNYETGRLMRTFQGYSWPRPFFPGSRNIEVKYVAGFNPTPPDLWMATMELIAHWWDKTQKLERGATRNRTGGTPAQDGLWQGMPQRIVNLINPYRNVAIG